MMMVWFMVLSMGCLKFCVLVNYVGDPEVVVAIV